MRPSIFAAILGCAASIFALDVGDTVAVTTQDHAEPRIRSRCPAISLDACFDRALRRYTDVIEKKPNATTYVSRAMIWKFKGEHDKAIADYSEAIRRVSWGLTHHDHTCAKLAWLLATSPVDALRDGKKAIEHATRACQRTEWKNCEWIDTLAAAYAETGDFQEAIKWQEKALSMCPEDQKDDLRSKLDLYKSGKPYREKR